MANESIRVDQVIGGVISSGSVAGDIVVNSVNNVTTEEQKNLAEAALEIQQLLDQLSQTYPTTTAAEKVTVAAKAMDKIERQPGTKKKIAKR